MGKGRLERKVPRQEKDSLGWLFFDLRNDNIAHRSTPTVGIPFNTLYHRLGVPTAEACFFKKEGTYDNFRYAQRLLSFAYYHVSSQTRSKAFIAIAEKINDETYVYVKTILKAQIKYSNSGRKRQNKIYVDSPNQTIGIVLPFTQDCYNFYKETKDRLPLGTLLIGQ